MLFVIKNLFGYIRPYKLLSFLFFLTLALDLLFLSLAPLSFQMIIDKAIAPKDTHDFTVIMTVLAISGFICVSAGMISDYVVANLNARVQNDLRQKLFAHTKHVRANWSLTFQWICLSLTDRWPFSSRRVFSHWQS